MKHIVTWRTLVYHILLLHCLRWIMSLKLSSSVIRFNYKTNFQKNTLQCTLTTSHCVELLACTTIIILSSKHEHQALSDSIIHSFRLHSTFSKWTERGSEACTVSVYLNVITPCRHTHHGAYPVTNEVVDIDFGRQFSVNFPLTRRNK